MTKTPLKVLLASPRGFCAGVDRAIHIVETALERFGAPVYVRHEIVHNRYVVQTLEAKGAVFVDDLDEVPDGARVIFSAHGVPKSVPAAAAERGLTSFDATCPLVEKVHREVERHEAEGCRVILIGHAGHPEVIGTMGQLPQGDVLLVEREEDVANLVVETDRPLAYATQTTLSTDETVGIIKALTERFPDIVGPKREDICYATTNRQRAVKAMAGRVDALLVLGAPNSSNSRRLVEVAAAAGCARARLVQRASEIDWTMLDGVRTLGITAGASAPEILVKEVLEALRDRHDLEVEEVNTVIENVSFKLPRELVDEEGT